MNHKTQPQHLELISSPSSFSCLSSVPSSLSDNQRVIDLLHSFSKSLFFSLTLRPCLSVFSRRTIILLFLPHFSSLIIIRERKDLLLSFEIFPENLVSELKAKILWGNLLLRLLLRFEKYLLASVPASSPFLYLDLHKKTSRTS